MITYCTIYRVEDREHIEGMLKSIPKNSKVLLLQTIKSDSIIQTDLCNTEFINNVTLNTLNITYANFYYNEWSFSDARNACMEFVTTEWILMLDADERLNLPLGTIDLSNVKDNVGGVYVNVESVVKNGIDNVVKTTAKLLRLYRNNDKFKWVFRCHEQIKNSIIDSGYELAGSDIMIEHFGYNLSNDVIIDKYRRNIHLMCQDVIENIVRTNDENWYILAKLWESLQDLLLAAGKLKSIK